ncbi:MAG: DUF1566 domain-containing protein [Candidatus Electrothrix aestuarii]|uniref:DUF1566 domain-containing protein n=1 Tax=Candidatus Electrothrix aestuarii TaxID=3062594 RepID=A0AAU8LWR8_9BACT|nr:DUF1566 domain-containing protein [Candidatus Electrothrix aestuarii]
MRIFFLMLCCVFSAATVHGEQTCKPDVIQASTPDSQFIDNRDGTVTDFKTGLMWKKCLEGVAGDNCENGSPGSFTWQQALQRPGAVNIGGGVAGYTDWRLPNVKELLSLVEEQCYNPAINLNRFPNTLIVSVWSASPCYEGYPAYSWTVSFLEGKAGNNKRNVNISSSGGSIAVRLVRDGR